MNRADCRGGDGWTLIEALVAVALTFVLSVVIASTSFTVHRILRDRVRRAGAGATVREELLRLAADLERACEPAEGAAFTLETPDSGPLRMDLHFHAFLPAHDEPDLQWAEIRVVRLQALERETGDGIRLLRIERPIAGPEALGPGRTSEIPGRVEAFLVEVYDGTNWMNAWPLSGGAPLPSAARASLAYAGAHGPATAGVETVIQAGVPVKPRMERRLAPPSAR